MICLVCICSKHSLLLYKTIFIVYVTKVYPLSYLKIISQVRKQIVEFCYPKNLKYIWTILKYLSNYFIRKLFDQAFYIRFQKRIPKRILKTICSNFVENKVFKIVLRSILSLILTSVWITLFSVYLFPLRLLRPDTDKKSETLWFMFPSNVEKYVFYKKLVHGYGRPWT